MRLLVTIPTLHGAGCERLVSELLPHLSARYEVTLALLKADVAFAIPESVRVIELGMGDLGAEHSVVYKGGRFVKRVLLLRRLLARERFDVVCSFIDGHNYATVLAAMACGQTGRTVVCENTYDDRFVEHNHHAKRLFPLHRLLLKFAYSRAARVIVVSKTMERFFRQRIGLNRRYVTIYNCYNPQLFFFRPDWEVADSRTPEYSAGQIRLVSIGKFMFQKNHEALITAFARVARADHRVVLYLLGVGERRAEIEALVKSEGLCDRVRFLGWKDNVGDYLRGAHVYVTASRYESFPHSIIEALACGCPVVTTDSTSALGELLDSVVDVVPQGDLDGFVNAVVRAVRDCRDESKRAARAEFARGRFDIETIAGQYIEVLESVHDGSSTPRRAH